MAIKRLAILGSTGSIGQTVLDIVRRHRDRFQVVAISAGKNIELLKRQIEEFGPRVVSVLEEGDYNGLKGIPCPSIGWGIEGFKRVATYEDAHLVVSAIAGAAGLIPTISAIEAGKDVALANKESLVMAGGLIMDRVRRGGGNLIPVDSEHSAIMQALAGHKREDVRRIILTASGGPFLNLPMDRLVEVTPEMALKHPNWRMGKKITIDSATLMNKGLEVIEARWLFDVPPERISVHIHPQSIVHSMVEYIDGSIVAQMGPADMRGPIAYALGYPDRIETGVVPLELCNIEKLTFLRPDDVRFPCLRLAYDAIHKGGTMPAVMSVADEVAVEAFLKGEIGFVDIARIVEETMKAHTVKGVEDIGDVLEAGGWARETARGIVTSRQ